MKLSEAQFQGRVIQDLTREGFATQVFTEVLASGVPDLHAGSPRTAFWLECKAGHFSKDGSPVFRHPVTGPQLGWLRKWWMRPSPTGIIFGSLGGWVYVPAPYIEQFCGSPGMVELVRDVPVTEDSLNASMGSPHWVV